MCDVFVPQLWITGQGNKGSIECIGDRQFLTATDSSCVGRLLVDCQRIMATGRNPGTVEEVLERRPIGASDDIEMHRVLCSLDLGRRHNGGIPQGLRVGGCNEAAAMIVAVEGRKFFSKDCGLEFIESRISS
jgi:hypothetical protein